MGTWAVDAFGNDTAADWAWELEETDDLSFVESTLDKAIVPDDAYLEAPEAAEALAAIEVIARLQGNWGVRNAYSAHADRWVEANKFLPDGSLIGKAHRFLDRVVGPNSELEQLWRESPKHSGWLAAVAELKSRIRA